MAKFHPVTGERLDPPQEKQNKAQPEAKPEKQPKENQPKASDAKASSRKTSRE